VKIPRDISGKQLAKRLGRMGYSITRQSGMVLRRLLADDCRQGKRFERLALALTMRR